MKKMLLRLFAVLMMVMTAMAFMPALAEPVLAVDGDDRAEHEVNISYGDITFTSDQIIHWAPDPNKGGAITEQYIEIPPPDFGTPWYSRNIVVVTGTTPGDDGVSHKIIVERGTTHHIAFRDLTMKSSGSSYPAVRLNSGAVVHLTLEGDNEISSRSAPGIEVPEGAKLTIKGAGDDPDANTLKVSASGGDNAGIGTGGSGNFCGNITIESGSISASGSGNGAGIGGSGGGSGNIVINGGNIYAYGGNNTGSPGGPGGAGIGAGGNAVASGTGGGSVAINGGSVYAQGGTGMLNGVPDAETTGIVATHITSTKPTVVLSSNKGILRLPASTENEDVFNAIVWTDARNQSQAKVYGNVLMSSEEDHEYYFNLGKGTLDIPENNSVTLVGKNGNEYMFDSDATLTGTGMVIGNIKGSPHYDPEIIKHTMSLASAQGAIHIVEPKPVYTGQPIPLEKLISIDKRYGEFYLDTDNWDKIVYLEGGTEPVPNDQIKNAGKYTINFTHKVQIGNSFPFTGVEILPKPMTENMVSMNKAFNYGEAITYTVSDGNTKLAEGTGKDYTVVFYQVDETGAVTGQPMTAGEVKEVGQYEAQFTARGNYTTVNAETGAQYLPVRFEVLPVSISTAVIKGFGSYVYNGSPQQVMNAEQNMTVTLNGKVIDRSDYYVTYSNDSIDPSEPYVPDDHRKYAGTVTVTVTPTEQGSRHYTDWAETTFEIGKRPVKILTAESLYPVEETGESEPKRPYDGTNLVLITKATLAPSSSSHGSGDQGVFPGDDVSIAIEGHPEDPDDHLKGSLPGKDVTAKGYTTVTIKDALLQGKHASNYRVVESKVNLSPSPFYITRLAIKEPDIEVKDELSASSKDKFKCTVDVKNKPNDGAEYLYGIANKNEDPDSVKWQESNSFDGLDSNTTYWFYAKVNDSDEAKINMYADPAPGITRVEHKTPLLPQDPPQKFDLEITLDPSGETYTVTIPAVEGAQYSFDGKTFNKNNVLKKVGPNETITGYARFPATKTHAVSEVTEASDITPPLTVKTPVITPGLEDGETSGNYPYFESVKVSISCGTKGATIYYTTDGAFPGPGDPVYKSPITVSEDTTIRAIAVKDEMNDSEVAEVDYYYEELTPTASSEAKPGGVKVTNDLKNSPSFNRTESITAALSRAITEDGEGYNYKNIAYYELTVKLTYDGEKFFNATADNFPLEGVEVTVPYPKGTDGSTHEFRVAHMFSFTSDRLNTTAGEIEKPEPTEGPGGLTFTVNGASPLAIGWVESAEEEGGGDEGGDEGEGGDGSTDPSGGAAGGADAQNLDGNGTAAGGTNADGSAAGANGTNANGTNGEGENANGAASGTGGVVDELVTAVSTGDFTNPLLWAVLAALSFIIMVVIIIKKRVS